MAEETPKRQFTEKEIVEAQANKVAAENGLKKAHPESDVTADDIKKYLSKIKSEQKVTTTEFLQGKEQLSFDMIFSDQPEKVKPKTPIEKMIESSNVPFEKVEIVRSEPLKMVVTESTLKEIVIKNKDEQVVLKDSELPEVAIDFIPETPSSEHKGVKFSRDLPEFVETKKVWDGITEFTANAAIEREAAAKNRTEWEPETDKSFTIPVVKSNEKVVESSNGDIELKTLLSEGLTNKFENGIIMRDNFVIYETPADFIDSIPEETRTIFAKHNDSGTSTYVTIPRSDKDQIRADYPELDSWVTTKQTVKENDFDTNYAESNTRLVDRLETMIHTKSLDKVDVNERKKDMENELSEVRNLEKSASSLDDIDDVPETNVSDEPEKPATKKTNKLKNK